ncbi:hypothetical protein HYU92_04920 [Candidatus Curtissbacteria bacterium]|nr:hypothetical protein [Candidatus Curtissbacteria bacterium]
MSLIDSIIKIILVLIGVAIFEGIFLVFLKIFPNLCFPESGGLDYCLGSLLYGSPIFIAIGATAGLFFPLFFRNEFGNLQVPKTLKRKAFVFIATFIVVLAIITMGLDNFRAVFV